MADYIFTSVLKFQYAVSGGGWIDSVVYQGPAHDVCQRFNWLVSPKVDAD